MSNQVDMFKYYASKLNLSKPQLEAVADCFRACFEADETGTEPEEAVPSENSQPIGNNEETRQRNMRWQNFLNKKLGINLAVDGKWGKEAADAYQQYIASKNKA